MEIHAEDLLRKKPNRFTVLVLAQLFNALNARSESASAFRGIFDDRWLWAAIALGTGLQVAVVHWPPLHRAFSTVPLTIDQWCFAMGSLVLWFNELRKVFLRAVDRDQNPPTPIHYHEHSASNAKD